MKIYTNTYTVFSFMDRIRILFGKETKGEIEIVVDEEVKVISSESKTTVKHFFKQKPIQLEAPVQ